MIKEAGCDKEVGLVDCDKEIWYAMITRWAIDGYDKDFID